MKYAQKDEVETKLQEMIFFSKMLSNPEKLGNKTAIKNKVAINGHFSAESWPQPKILSGNTDRAG